MDYLSQVKHVDFLKKNYFIILLVVSIGTLLLLIVNYPSYFFGLFVGISLCIACDAYIKRNL